MKDLKELKQIIPFKWRVQSYSRNYNIATCVAYIDARDVMDLLDEVIGADKWQCDYKEIKGNLYSGIGININNEWIWKWNCGTESYVEKAKGEASDAMKRAALLWGIGRFLYELPIQYVKSSEIKTDENFPFAVDDNGNKIKDLTAYLNKSPKVASALYNLYQTYPHYKNIDIVQKELQDILTEIDNCVSLDELRSIREEHELLETTNNLYKKALAKKYEILNDKTKIELAS